MLELLAILGGGSGLASLFGIAINLRRSWIQSIESNVHREARHIELIAAMERQTEAMKQLSGRMSNVETDMVSLKADVVDLREMVSEASRGRR